MFQPHGVNCLHTEWKSKRIGGSGGDGNNGDEME